MRLIDKWALTDFFKDVQRNRISLREISDKDSTIRIFESSTGWKIAIFNDAGHWDYVEWVKAPTGETMRHDELEEVYAHHVRKFINSQRENASTCWNW